jgi:uncharacterized cupredoxin-like copper-binding protein
MYSSTKSLGSAPATSLKLCLNLCMILATVLFLGGTAAAGEVNRAQFTTSIDDREPVSMIDSLDSSVGNSISFFTEISDMAGQTVTHQWMHQDKIMFEKTFEVKAERWRIWTSKTLIPDWTGTWTVNVLDNERVLLASKTFEYQ